MALSPITNEQAVALGLEDGVSGSSSSPIPHQQAIELGLEEDGLTPPPDSGSVWEGLWNTTGKPIVEGIAQNPWTFAAKALSPPLGAAMSAVNELPGAIRGLGQGMSREWERGGRELMQAGGDDPRNLVHAALAVPHMLAGSIPGLASMADSTTSQFEQGKWKTGIGEGLGNLGMIMGPGALEGVGAQNFVPGAGTRAAMGGALSKAAVKAALKRIPGAGALGDIGNIARQAQAAEAARAATEAYRTLPGRTGTVGPAPVNFGPMGDVGNIPELTPPPGMSSTNLNPQFTGMPEMATGGNIPAPSLPNPITSSPFNPVANIHMPSSMLPRIEALPEPPIAGEITGWQDFIRNNRQSKTSPSPWEDPQVLQGEAVNAALDAQRRTEAAESGLGSGFEPGLDQPAPRWNPMVSGHTTDPATGLPVKTLPKPPEFAQFGDEPMPIEDVLAQAKGKQFMGQGTGLAGEGGKVQLQRLSDKYGEGGPLADKAVEGEVNPVVDGGRVYLLWKQNGKITDYALLQDGVLQERVRGGYLDPALESPGMNAIMDSLWETRSKWKASPNTMSEGALKSWQRYKPRKPKGKR